MEIILTHEHMDFDALASMVAASSLHEGASMVLSKQQSEQVQQYLAIYRDSFPFVSEEHIIWENVDHIILTDTPSLDRTIASFLTKSTIPVTVYDHHPLPAEQKRANTTYYLENTGAAITILLEEWMKREWKPTDFEATLYALGLYTDTGSFTYPGTSLRDLKAGVFLMENGMKLELVQQFSEDTLSVKQQEAFQQFLSSSENIGEEGLDVVVASLDTDHYIGSLNVITSRLMETTGADAVITVTSMHNKVFIIGRSASDRINLIPLMQHFHGGGHERAASASVKGSKLSEILQEVKHHLKHSITPPLTAASIMSVPVKTITPDISVEETKKRLIQYGHNGFPVVDENNELIGIISRRDIDKAVQHNLGHAPVKGYMSTNPVTVSKDTSFEDIQGIFIQHNIGRAPVLDDQKMIGIVSRTDIIEQLHYPSPTRKKKPENMKKLMETHLPEDVLQLLKQAGQLAAAKQMNAFIIGGMVRDLLLETSSEDIDIVVEGDGIALAEDFASSIGGSTAIHETFGTATVTTKSGRRLDFTTSRTEYYEKPAALPTVSRSNIKEDLFRRDFTMNAMAVSLRPSHFGELLDYFNGLEDIKNKTLRVLHNLSFVEDPTRIIRGIRFEQRFSFQMNQETTAFVHHSVSAVSSLSRTRIASEFKYLFHETDPLQSLERLRQLGVLNKFFPGALWEQHSRAVLTKFLQEQGVVGTLEHWFCIILCLYLKNEQTVKYAEAATLTKPQKITVKDIAFIFAREKREPFESLGSIHSFAAHTCSEALYFTALAWEAGDNTDTRKAAQWREYRKRRKELPTFVNGHDLKEAGLHPGPAFKEYLFELEQQVLDQNITSRTEALTYIYARMKPNNS
ncbi:CBS domain-containing protein [Salibacterium aidingense]|uniref:CBS domain-containing protein n=1 Tax=Salibacterium aidingense TaxID=384933 RepID=UPI0004142BDA|nr:CBS domain-containing protein [Salibacterium aidingense]